jgi:hypothetical protein
VVWTHIWFYEICVLLPVGKSLIHFSRKHVLLRWLYDA